MGQEQQNRCKGLPLEEMSSDNAVGAGLGPRSRSAGRHRHHSAVADPFGRPASASWEECLVHRPPLSSLGPLGAPSFPTPLPKPTP